MPLSDQYQQRLMAGHLFDDDTALPPLSQHLVAGSGEFRRILAAPSILHHAISNSTMFSNNSVASSVDATKALGLLGGRSFAEKLRDGNKAKMTPQFFMKDQQGKFPVILHQALLELERVGDTSTAAFLPDGKSFAIKNQYLFEETILRVFFPKMKGFASFQRQLNLYDFKRIGGAGIDRGSYCHELFHRDLPSKACEMKRTKIKGGKPRRRRASSTTSIAAATQHNSDDTGGE
jgi:hypothetical protein